MSQLTHVWISTDCWVGVNWVSIEMSIKCWLSIARDVNRMPIEMSITGRLRVSIDTWQQMPLVHMIEISQDCGGVVWGSSWLMHYNLNYVFFLCKLFKVLEEPRSKRIDQLEVESVRMGKKTTMEEEKKSQATITQSSLWNKLMMFMTSPADPSNLAALRIMFGKVVEVYFFVSVHSRTLLNWSPIGKWNLATRLVLIIVGQA